MAVNDFVILPAHGASHITIKNTATVVCSFLCVFMDLDSVSVHKHEKKKRKKLGQYRALTEAAWSIENVTFGFRGNSFSRDTACNPERPI